MEFAENVMGGAYRSFLVTSLEWGNTHMYKISWLCVKWGMRYVWSNLHFQLFAIAPPLADQCKVSTMASWYDPLPFCYWFIDIGL